jgi:hypothetical protein
MESIIVSSWQYFEIKKSLIRAHFFTLTLEMRFHRSPRSDQTSTMGQFLRTVAAVVFVLISFESGRLVDNGTLSLYGTNAAPASLVGPAASATARNAWYSPLQRAAPRARRGALRGALGDALRVAASSFVDAAHPAHGRACTAAENEACDTQNGVCYADGLSSSCSCVRGYTCAFSPQCHVCSKCGACAVSVRSRWKLLGKRNGAGCCTQPAAAKRSKLDADTSYESNAVPAAANTNSLSSRHRGVSWDKQRKKWRVKGVVDGKAKTVGHFADEIKAARAYDTFVIDHKLLKHLNFPDEPAAQGHKTSATSSRYRGVTWKKSSRKWLVKDRRNIIGTFANEIDAAKAYDAYLNENNIDFHRNFLDGAPAPRSTSPQKKAMQDAIAASRAAQIQKQSSRFRGVSWNKLWKKWYVYINSGGTKTYVAGVSNESVAAHIYDLQARRNNIQFPDNQLILNYPEAPSHEAQEIVGEYYTKEEAAKLKKEAARRTTKKKKWKTKGNPRRGNSGTSSRRPHTKLLVRLLYLG